MLEKFAWWILARRQKKYVKAKRYHDSEHIKAALATRKQKDCYLCCILENTDWLAWSTRFDLAAGKEEHVYFIDYESGIGNVVRRMGLD